MNVTSLPTTHEFLLGGGEMGELIRSTDWSKTPVGPVETWPQSLRTAVSIMLNTHFPMYIAWDKEFTQFYNDGYRPILGSTKHPAAMGRSTKFTFAEIWDIIGPMFEGVLEGKAVGFTDFMLPLDRHGFTEECYFIFSYSPIKQEDGSTGGVLVTVTETTERVLGERRLKSLRELGDKASLCKDLRLAPASIIDVLANNKHDIPFSLLYTFDQSSGRFAISGATGIDLNTSTPSLERILEHARNQSLIGVPVSELFDRCVYNTELPWPESPVYCCACLLSRADQKDGFGIIVLGISARLRFDHQYHNFFKLLSDQITTLFTNVSAFEEERRRSEALAELDRAKTAFFSNISHEFRTPLTLMLGPLEEMMHYREKLDVEQLENVALAHRNALRLQKLVNALLDFSRIESGRIDASFRPVNLAAITEEIVGNFRSIVENAGLALVANLKPLEHSVYVDYDMWEKVVFNLLSNAFKYTLEGSIEISLEEKGEQVLLKVADTGVGIPKEELPNVFVRFHRVANTAGRSHEGTGIGLSLVAELVKIHGGNISVESELGRGTVFTVVIPKGFTHLSPESVSHESTSTHSPATAESFLQEAEAFLSSSTGRLEQSTPLQVDTVLVADDNADMIRYLCRLLEPGYRVMTAANGKEALQKISELKPDLVISDIMMPVLDGIGLLREIKQDLSTANIPVILLSARAGEEARIEGLDFGADDYLVKPFSSKELLARVKAQINLSRTRSHLSRLLRQVFNQTPAAITIIKRENYVVEFANDLYLQIVDKGPEFIGRSLFESMPELQAYAFRDYLDQVMSTGIAFEGKEMEIYLNRFGKRERTFFNFVYHPLREQDGAISGVIVVCFEVTDLVLARNRAEESEVKLEAKVKERTWELEEKNSLLLKANEELEQFAYVASHDLQEPLRKIRTFSSILERKFSPDEESQKYFDKIHASSNRMAKLIRDVLNYSRLTSRTAPFEEVDLKAVLGSVITDFELLIAEKSAEIIADDLPVVHGIPLQLEQLFANLLGNSLKFSDGRPVIEIRWRAVSSNQTQTPRDFIEIRFRDNGVGFDPKYSELVFTIFQRLHNKEASGTGIGLALCKRIVENHNGSIRVDSSPGEGTTFFIRLPR